MESFNTDDVPRPKPQTPDDMDKKHSKKLKQQKKQLKQQKLKDAEYDKREELRQNEAFSDDDEEYLDKNE